jgi:hypothetical protein
VVVKAGVAVEQWLEVVVEASVSVDMRSAVGVDIDVL